MNVYSQSCKQIACFMDDIISSDRLESKWWPAPSSI